VQLRQLPATELAGLVWSREVSAREARSRHTDGVTLQRDLIATTNSPVVDNLLKRGAVIIGDPGALNVLAQLRDQAAAFDMPAFSRVLTRRATLLREWMALFDRDTVVVMPVSAELPFENHLDMQGDPPSRGCGRLK
jgi:hypothetical protein